MSIDDVADLARRRQYVASASQTEFDYPFPIFTDADLIVDVDGVTLDLDVDYTVSGAGDDTGGTITLDTGLDGGEVVTLYCDTAIERTSDYQQNGPLSSSNLNDDLDKLVIICQELKAKFQRSLRIPFNAAVTDDDIQLYPANYASNYLTFDANGKPTPAALSASTMTRAIIGNLLNPQTLDEFNAGQVPVDFAYVSGFEMDARRHGFSTSASASANAAALTAAIAALGVYGGSVVLPPGVFSCDAITIPEAVWVRGAGFYSTRITYAGNETFASLGSAANTGVLKGPCGLSNCALYLTHKDGEGVRLRETKGAIVARMYIEGTQTAGRTNRLVVIDGGNASSFFNHIDDVICNHGENSFVVLTSGSQRATCSTFTNCSATGDVGTVGAASKGLSLISSGGGDGTAWHGGNFEGCGTGVYSDSTGLGMSVFGTRFESNTKDIVLTPGCKPIMFFGINTDTAYNVTDTNALGGFYGCQTTSGSRWTAQGTLVATLTTMAAPVTGNMLWRKEGVDVELQLTADILGTLNGTSLQLSGIPSGLIPGVKHIIPCYLVNGGNARKGLARINDSGGTIDFYIDTVSGAFVQPSLTGFSNTTLTGLPAGWCVRFRLD